MLGSAAASGHDGVMPPSSMIPGQSAASSHRPSPPPPQQRPPDDRPRKPQPNTGPDKVKGEFAVNDEIFVAGLWAKLFYYKGRCCAACGALVEPQAASDTEGLCPKCGVAGPFDTEMAWVIRDCGCGGLQLRPVAQLVHKWHHVHGDASPT